MHFENGFRYMKVKLGFGVADDIEVMQAIMKKIDPSKATLMVDSNHAYGRAEALFILGQTMADMNLRWYEEPVAPEDYEGYSQVRRRLPMAIAGGENEHSLYGFNALFDAGAVDIAQPDIGSCGGFTAARHITALAQAKGMREINPHVWSSAVAQAASIQLIAALPVAHHSMLPASSSWNMTSPRTPFAAN